MKESKESDKGKNEIKSKSNSILSPKSSNIKNQEKSIKHPSFTFNENKSNVNSKKVNNNLLFSKFDFNKDYMKNEAKAFKIKIKNLNKINLLENDKVDNLYNWKDLCNNFKPLKSYVSQKEFKSAKKSKTINELSEYNSPILLVDLPESQMNLFFHKNRHRYNQKIISSENNSNSKDKNNERNMNLKNDKISHNIRPVSMYMPRDENSCFYYSDAFNDYYKEDFKSFSQKIPVLKAKLKIRAEKLTKQINKKDHGFINKYKLLEEKRKDKNIIFNKQHLILAGERKYPVPLVKSVYREKYLSLNNIEDDVKNSERENKDEINELEKNNFRYKFKNRLLLSYYDINDPSLSLFNDKMNLNVKTIKIKDNNPKKEIKVYQKEKTPIKKDKEVQKFESINEIKNKSEKPKLQINIQKNLFYNNNKAIKNYKSKKTKNLNTYYYTNPYDIKQTLENNYNNIYHQEGYTSSPTSFPLKTSSDVGNTSYNRIKQLIKGKQFLNKFKFNYPIPNNLTSLKKEDINNIKSDLELILESKKIKPKKNNSFFDSIYENKTANKIYQHWDKNGNLIKSGNKKCNMIYFNKCIKTKFDKDFINLKKMQDNECFYPINNFNRGNIDSYRTEKNKNKIINKYKNKEDKNNNINNENDNWEIIDIKNQFFYNFSEEE